jgi:hypothetical protein
MNTFEKNPKNDTVLSGGLVVIAIAWVMLAAVQGLVDQHGRDDAHIATAGTTTAAPAAVVQLHSVKSGA